MIIGEISGRIYGEERKDFGYTIDTENRYY